MSNKHINNILRKIFKAVLWLLFAIIFVLFIVALPYLWNNCFTYPKLEKEREAFWETYKKPQQFIKLKEYKGVFHMHSYWLHHSRGTLNEILLAAKLFFDKKRVSWVFTNPIYLY